MLKTTIIGHIGQDAETRQVNADTATQFSVASTERWKDAQGAPQERTTWVNCTIWNAGGVKEYLKRGTQVYVEGFPSARAYQNQQQQLVGTMEVRVNNIQLLGSPKEKAESGDNQQQQQAPQQQAQGGQQSAPSGAADDLPF